MSTMSNEKTTRETLREQLDAFANTLEAAGFRVYRPERASLLYIGFAREVDGQWCSATVQPSEFPSLDPSGWRWFMNIVPSRADGSSMFLDDVPDGSPLTVETAEAVTRPSANNSRISKPRQNAGWPARWGTES